MHLAAALSISRLVQLSVAFPPLLSALCQRDKQRFFTPGRRGSVTSRWRELLGNSGSDKSSRGIFTARRGTRRARFRLAIRPTVNIGPAATRDTPSEAPTAYGRAVIDGRFAGVRLQPLFPLRSPTSSGHTILSYSPSESSLCESTIRPRISRKIHESLIYDHRRRVIHCNPSENSQLPNIP